MQKISEAELNVRINKFITKKMQKYPNIAKADKIDAKKVWQVDRVFEGTLGTFGGTRPNYSIKV